MFFKHNRTPRRPQVRTFNDGSFAESSICNMLEQMSGLKIIFKNLLIKTANGDTCEIDVVMLHETGIYVIESKDFSGWIFGNEKDLYWTQCVGNERHRFYNPIKQNRKHLEEIHKIIGDWGLAYFNVIVFGNNCLLKKVIVHSSVSICHRKNFFGYIQNNIYHQPTIYNREMLTEIYYKIMEQTQFGQDARQKHISSLRHK